MNDDIPTLVAALRGLPGFADLAEGDLRTIAGAGRLVTVPQGWSLIWEATPADKAYVVLSGEVDIRRGGEVLARLGAGDVVGEVAIVEHRLRTATVVAATPLEVLHFTRESLEQLYAAVPGFRALVDAAVIAHA